MAEIEYDTDMLRRASTRFGAAGEAAGSVAAHLGAPPAGGLFGQVSNGDQAHQIVTAAHSHHAQAATRLADNLDMAGKRAVKTAGLGDELTDSSTRIASQAASRVDR